MLSWVIQITVISIILIFLVHHLINFFKATLTVPKIKDLVNSPNQKYENIYNILKKPSKDLEYSESAGYSDQKEYTLIDLLPKTDEPSMKNELKNFLKKQLHTSNAEASVNNMNISSLDSISSTSFSPF
jgi:hypothetical protein